MTTALKRHPNVPLRAWPFDERAWKAQYQAGQFTMEGGEPYAIPKLPGGWEIREGKAVRPGVQFEKKVYGREDLPPELREVYDRLSRDEMKQLYRATTGHDLHFSVQGNLYARQFHAGWADPITGAIAPPPDLTMQSLYKTHFRGEHECRLGEKCPKVIWGDWNAASIALSRVKGWTEDLGWLSGGLVTDAFVSEIVDELVSATGTEFADFDFHEVGTATTAENNDHTALQTTSGIARVTGTPTDADPDYQNVGTITADASETWEEHGLFNNSTGAAMMDRSLTGGQAVVSSDQVEYTYTLTVNPEV